MDDETREFDFDDGSLTENTRVGYPVDYISTHRFLVLAESSYLLTAERTSSNLQIR